MGLFKAKCRVSTHQRRFSGVCGLLIQLCRVEKLADMTVLGHWKVFRRKFRALEGEYPGGDSLSFGRF